MTIMQHVSKWMAKKFLNATHCRLGARVGNQLFSEADMLLSPLAMSAFKAIGTDPDHEYSIGSVENDNWEPVEEREGIAVGTIVILPEGASHDN